VTHPNAIQLGYVVEVEIDGIKFEASITSKNPKVCGIEPFDPFHHQQRFCDYTQILRVIERHEPGEAAA
jgi:hypothetical protein